jgi:VCBS repeat protein
MGYTKNDPFYVGRWIQVLINNGDGTFRDETSTRLPQSDNSGVWPYSIQVADVNHDGKPDIGVSLFPSPSQAPPFYLNRGDGTFAPISRNTFLSPPPQMFTLLDANRDGHLDVFGSTAAASGGPEEHYVVEQLARPGRVRAAKASRGTFRDRVRISWRAVPQSARYEVWRSLRSKRTRIGTTSSTRFEDRRARRGTRYRYFVRATNRVGVGAFSAGAVGYRR